MYINVFTEKERERESFVWGTKFFDSNSYTDSAVKSDNIYLKSKLRLFRGMVITVIAD